MLYETLAAILHVSCPFHSSLSVEVAINYCRVFSCHDVLNNVFFVPSADLPPESFTLENVNNFQSAPAMPLSHSSARSVASSGHSSAASMKALRDDMVKRMRLVQLQEANKQRITGIITYVAHWIILWALACRKCDR